MPADAWSRSDLYRLVHSLHLTHGNFSLLCSLLPSKTPTMLAHRLSLICEHISPNASKWHPNQLAAEALRLHGGHAIQHKVRHPSSERKNRVTARITPLSPADSAAIRANGHNPNVEVVLRGHRPLLHVLKHLYDKWGLPLILKKKDQQAVLTDVSIPVHELTAGETVLPLGFSVLRVAIYDKLLCAPSRRATTKGKNLSASSRRVQKKNQTTTKPAKRKVSSASRQKSAIKPSATPSTTTCAPSHVLNLDPGNTLQGPLPPLPQSIDAPATPQNPPLKRQRHSTIHPEIPAAMQNTGLSFPSAEDSHPKSIKLPPPPSLDGFPFTLSSPVTERNGKRVLPPLPASLDGFASPAHGNRRPLMSPSLGGFCKSLSKPRDESSQLFDGIGNCFASPMKDRNGKRVLPPLPFSLGMNNSISSPITQRDGKNHGSPKARPNITQRVNLSSDKNLLPMLQTSMDGFSNPFGAKGGHASGVEAHENNLTALTPLRNLEGFPSMFEELGNMVEGAKPGGNESFKRDGCSSLNGCNGSNVTTSASSGKRIRNGNGEVGQQCLAVGEGGGEDGDIEADVLASQDSAGEQAVMQRLKGHLERLTENSQDGGAGRHSFEDGGLGDVEDGEEFDLDDGFGEVGSFSLSGLLA